MPQIIRSIHALPTTLLQDLPTGVLAIVGASGTGKTFLASAILERHLDAYPAARAVIVANFDNPLLSTGNRLEGWAGSHGWTCQTRSRDLAPNATLTGLALPALCSVREVVAHLTTLSLTPGDVVFVDELRHVPVSHQTVEFLRSVGAALMVTEDTWPTVGERLQPPRALFRPRPQEHELAEVIRLHGNETPEQRELVTIRAERAQFLFQDRVYDFAAPARHAHWISSAPACLRALRDIDPEDAAAAVRARIEREDPID